LAPKGRISGRVKGPFTGRVKGRISGRVSTFAVSRQPEAAQGVSSATICFNRKKFSPQLAPDATPQKLDGRRNIPNYQENKPGRSGPGFVQSVSRGAGGRLAKGPHLGPSP
jgi:hypothetical protein